MALNSEKQRIALLRKVAIRQRGALLFLFLFVVVSSQLYPAQKQCVWEGVEKIVAVADIHGDYDKFELILKETGLIDDALKWSGGKTHLVQTGDILDRGPDARRVFDLLIRLEEEAEAAGGKVHVLLGNHEEANLLGVAFDRVGYVTPEQLVAFLPEKFRKKKEKQALEDLADNSDSSINTEEELRKFWEDKIRNDPRTQDAYNRNFKKLYGKWLLSKNVVIKINDIIFVHGGINISFSNWSLEEINKRARFEFSFLSRGRPVDLRITYQPNSPLWYRGLISNDEEEYQSEVDEILKNLGAKFIVVGHTVRREGNPAKLSRFNGKVWGIDTGISSFYGGFLTALIIEQDTFRIWGKNHEDS
jgi:hypothetical protein